MRQAIERAALAFLRRERQVLLPGKSVGGAFEQPHVVPLDRAEMTEQYRCEFVAAGEAEKTGKFVQRRGVGRQGVGLLVGDHLQAMLDTTQEIVGRGKVIARGDVDPAAGGEGREGRDRCAAAQLGVAATGDELLRLREKLDLANPAATELDVVTFDRDLAMTPVGMDLLLHRVHVRDRRVVEIFAPHKGRKIADEPLAGSEIAGARPCLDECGALPVLPAALVVVERGFDRDGDLGRGWIGAQPQVDTEDITLGRALLKELHKVAAQPHEELRRLRPRREHWFARIEEEHEIDVA